MTLDTIYHIGHLAIDRDLREVRSDGTLGVRTAAAQALHEKAMKMLYNALRGKVHLYQRRCAHGFEYHCRGIGGV